jgi:hypothetical protein
MHGAVWAPRLDQVDQEPGSLAMKCLDPTTMTAAERVAEIAGILAAGCQRLFARTSKSIPTSSSTTRNRAEQLDVVGQAEAPCPSTMECPA